MAQQSAVTEPTDQQLLDAYDSPDFVKFSDALTEAQAERLAGLVQKRGPATPAEKPPGQLDDLPPEGLGRAAGQAWKLNDPSGMGSIANALFSVMRGPAYGAKEYAGHAAKLYEAGTGMFESLLASPAREAQAAVAPSSPDGSTGQMSSAELQARLRHLVSAVPVLGPEAVEAKDFYEQGRPYSAAGQIAGMGFQVFGPKMLRGVAPRLNLQRAVLPADAASDAAATARGVEVPIHLRTNNTWLTRNYQRLKGTKAGERLASEQAERGAVGSHAWARDIQQSIKPGAGFVSNEAAAQELLDALTDLEKLESGTPATGAHPAVPGRAREHYDTVRGIQGSEAMDTIVPIAIPEHVRVKMAKHLGAVPSQAEMMEMRAIAEELKNQRYSGKTYQEAGRGRGGDLDVTRGRVANADVYDDIRQHAPGVAHMTGEQMSAAIEKALDKGTFTDPAHGALAVAKARIAGKGGRLRGGQGTLGKDAGWWATGKENMQWPVDLSEIRPNLRDLYLNIKKGPNSVKAAQSPGFKVLEEIVNGPDHVPLMELKGQLSAIKQLAGFGGDKIKSVGEGTATNAVQQLQQAFDTALQRGGPRAVEAMKRGDAAVSRAHLVDNLRSTLEGRPAPGMLPEPAQIGRKIITPGNLNLKRLEKLAAVAPEQVRTAGRAWFDNGFSKVTEKGAFDMGAVQEWVKEWNALGKETKQLVFGRVTSGGAQLVQEAEHFFNTLDRLSQTRGGPVIVGQTTGSALPTAVVTGAVAGPAAGVTAGAMIASKNALSAMKNYPLSHLLYTPGGAQILEQGLRIPIGDTAKVLSWNARVQRALAEAERLPVARAAEAEPTDERTGR